MNSSINHKRLSMNKENILKNLLYPWMINWNDMNPALNENINIAYHKYRLDDLIGRYKSILNNVLNPPLSIGFKLLSRYPILYKKIPRKIKNTAYHIRKTKIDIEEYLADLELDKIRFILKNIMEKLISKKISLKKSYSKNIGLTHDIDSRSGLKKSRKILEVEEKYNIRSTWFIPTNHYELNGEAIDYLEEISNYGELASHGNKHTPELIMMNKDKILNELLSSKNKLEKISKKEVIGFRAPLLQHNEKIFEAVKLAGFKYTSTIPTLEYKHPATGNKHGIKTVFPIFIKDILEIPLSVIQDHQLLYVHNLNVKEALNFMESLASSIIERGGQAIILIHPDYKIADEINLYEEFINGLVQENTIKPLSEIYNSIINCIDD